MLFEHELNRLVPEAPTQLVGGAFDGLHRGHQALLGEVVVAARAGAGQAVVLTFDPLPRQFFNGNAGHFWLSSLDERLEQFAVLGLDGVIVQPFDMSVATLSARAFLSWIREHLRLAALWAGPDFALGHRREGTLDVLRRLGVEVGFEVHTFAPFIWRGTAVHSSDIRRLLSEGHIEEANDLLGRPYRLTGVVCPGEQRGRQLGFPTANLEIPPARLLPQNGIYVCRARLERGAFEAVTNVGTRPTVDDGIKANLEVHILDFAQDIYGRTIDVIFRKRIREERKFGSLDELKARIGTDVSIARTHFGLERGPQKAWNG